MSKGIQRKLKKVRQKVLKLIRDHAKHGMYGAGLASEGYNGGYYDALNDVELALRGVDPTRFDWWDE